MKGAAVFYNDLPAGVLRQVAGGYCFRYEDTYFADASCPPISLTLPKTQQFHTSPVLFPFFFGLLAEGTNKELQCRLLHLDEADDFSRLLLTATEDTIGAVTLKPLDP
ncbi:HipA N-terminal domain-containing protein [Paraflavisolibacter sp. H34]|uniref:HipA N-terminal domain-containing protein n=1 Tax=Huijunlia imazamoxiresistens TaxID=3127457 RepID=UPI003018442F